LPLTTASFPTATLSHPSNPTSTPTATSSPAIQPVIRKQPGDIYETVFSIPVGQDSIIKYFGGGNTEINGPNAIAVLPDDSFLIADLVSNRLLHYDPTGSLLKIIELKNFGIKTVVDLRVKGGEIFLLETSYEHYRVHRLTLDGALIASKEIPYRFPIGEKDLTLENGLTGIVIDCENNIILEVTGGSKLFPLSDVQSQADPAKITQGIFCNGKRYRVTTPGLWQAPQISIGDVTYQTQLTHGHGGLSFLDVLQNGSFYVVRDDVVNAQVIKVDQTVFFVGADGVVQGAARVPLSEFYYYVMRKLAISPKGEVLVLLPRHDSVDIVRLNFYRQLEPLIQGAVIPQITLGPNNP
jgi:hypothetical protein